MFSSSPLMESFPVSRFPSPIPSPTKTETDFPLDVDESFNSSMSFSCAGDGSPMPPAPLLLSSSANNMKSLPASPLPTPTIGEFLSPTPFNLMGSKPRRPDPVPIQSPRKDDDMQGLSMMQPLTKRTFGRELSLNPAPRSRTLGPSRSGGMMLPPALPENKASGSRPRGGIPMKWSSSNDETSLPKLCFQPALVRHETDPSVHSPRSLASTAGSDMDVDSPHLSSRRPSAVQASPAFSGASSFSGSPGLGSFFCDSPGAPSALPPAKRRSLVNGSPSSPSSPSAKRASYGRPTVDKTNSSSALLFGGTAPRPATLAARRNVPYKRPTLIPSDKAIVMDGQRSASATSAYPVLYGAPQPSLANPYPKAKVAPMRRAYSVCDQPQMGMMSPDTEDDENEFENSPSMTIHAEYARRTGQKFNARVDGSPDFKPMRSSFAASSAAASPSKCKRASPYGHGGMPGFGDNEMDGKILPCHKVKEDGLVRITPETMGDLLDGKYRSKIKRYHVLDCRFDYEFAGGHIADAVNVKSMDALDELLLLSEKGLHSTGNALPDPSRSGQLGEGEQVVLIFHCEFSAKRAPTFAKHLRARDRTLNHTHYPKIFYPEVYILEGGYSGFYECQPTRCDPQGYVPMDDPRHFERRNSDLHDFRKFARTKSFTYGETQQAAASTGPRPPCPPLAFAAASAAVGRRQGPTITEEEQEVDSSPAPGMGSPGYQASPCPRVVSLGAAPVFGFAKPRQLARVGFQRVQSYNCPRR